MTIRVFTDGTCHGRISAYAFFVFRDGTADDSLSQVEHYSEAGIQISRFVENPWEYYALYRAATWVADSCTPELEHEHEVIFYSDFKPMVEYASRRKASRRPNMIEFHRAYLEPIWPMLRDFSISFIHIKRSKNRLADQLARRTIKEYLGRQRVENMFRTDTLPAHLPQGDLHQLV